MCLIARLTTCESSWAMNTPRLIVKRVTAACLREIRSMGTAAETMDNLVGVECRHLVGGSREATRFQRVQGSLARRVDCVGVRTMGEGNRVARARRIPDPIVRTSLCCGVAGIVPFRLRAGPDRHLRRSWRASARLWFQSRLGHVV